MDIDNLPAYSERDYLGDKGVRLVDDIISDELKWVFRDLRKIDLGIDGQIELIDEKNRGTGRLLAVQIKCGLSFFSEATESGFVFRGDKKHLKYWIEHSLPVIVIICNSVTKICYWQEVTSGNTVPLKNDWKMVIPSSNILNEHAKDALIRLAGKPQHNDIAGILLYRHLYEKYIRKIEICSLFELPRDFHKFAYLAKIENKTVMIDYHYDPYGEVTLEDINEIVKWKDYNDQVCGPNPLHIYMVSESIEALKLSPEIINFFELRKDLTYFRLHYSKKPFFWIDELDENDASITFWPSD
jgi:hypothetical protein